MHRLTLNSALNIPDKFGWNTYNFTWNIFN